jgi:hypothetical protein
VKRKGRRLGWWEAVEGFIKVEVFRTITLITNRQNGVGKADFIEGRDLSSSKREGLEGGVLIFGWGASRNGLILLSLLDSRTFLDLLGIMT